MSEMDSHSSTTSSDRHCMHGDGPGMPVGEADEEHYFSPTNDVPGAAGSGANGSPESGGALHGDQEERSQQGTVDQRTLTHAPVEQQSAPRDQEDLLGLPEQISRWLREPLTCGSRSPSSLRLPSLLLQVEPAFRSG